MKKTISLISFSIIQALLACALYCLLESIFYVFYFKWINLSNPLKLNIYYFFGLFIDTVGAKLFKKVVFLYLLAILFYNFIVYKKWITNKMWFTIALFMSITIALHYKFNIDAFNSSSYNFSILLYSLISMLIISLLINYTSKIILKILNQ